MQVLKALMWTTASLYVLFQTSAVYDYLRVLPLPEKIKKMKEYERERVYNFSLSYKLFYLTNYDSFFVKLATCPYCLGAWLSIGFSVLFSCTEWIPAVYLGSLSTYYAATNLLKWLDRMESKDE